MNLDFYTLLQKVSFSLVYLVVFDFLIFILIYFTSTLLYLVSLVPAFVSTPLSTFYFLKKDSKVFILFLILILL